MQMHWPFFFNSIAHLTLFISTLCTAQDNADNFFAISAQEIHYLVFF